MKTIFTALTGLALSAGVAAATNYPLVDTGALTHAIYGRGIEIRVQPSPMPEDGIDGSVISEALAGICQHYAPVVIPHVQAATGLENATFVAVRVIEDGSLEHYRLKAFRLAHGTCGAPL